MDHLFNNDNYILMNRSVPIMVHENQYRKNILYFVILVLLAVGYPCDSYSIATSEPPVAEDAFVVGPCLSGNLLVQRWLGASGSTLSDLTSLSSFPDSPDETAYITSGAGPVSYGDNYGTRVLGYIIPSETGNYTFNITGDDHCSFSLSTDNDPSNLAEIASISGWTGVTEHTKYSTQTSSTISLVAGQWYAIEFLQKEGGGGDHFTMYWRTPSVPSTWNVIPSGNIGVSPEMTLSVSNTAGPCIESPTQLQVTASGGTAPYSYEWDGPGSFSSTSSTISVSDIGTYNVTVTDAYGCSEEDSGTVTASSYNLTINGGDTNICTDETISLSASITGGVGSYSYQWQSSTFGNEWSDISGATSANYTSGALVASLNYRVVLTSSTSSCDEIISDPTFVTVDVMSIINRVTEDQSICDGESVTLKVNDVVGTGGLLDYSSWTLGTGSAPNFYRNGSTNENHRIIDKDPWGNDAIVWEARPGASSNADGGWNSTYYPIDNTQTYRVSVWVNSKVLGTNGRFYLGLSGSGTANNVIAVTSGTSTTNPYFFYSNSPATNLIEDEWVLVVGHVRPVSHTGTTLHPESGRYTANGGKYGDIYNDYKFVAGTQNMRHRTYLYYCTDVTARQQMVYPRIDLIDGTEPSIDDLLSGFDTNGGLGTNASWEWYEDICGGTSISSNDEVTVTPTSTTTYYVKAEGDCGDTDCLSTTVTFNDLPDDTVLNDGPIRCNHPNVTLTAFEAGVDVDYLWSTGATTQSISVSTNGTYDVTITDGEGCSIEGSSTVTTAPLPNAVFNGDSDICIGQSVYLSPNSGGQWSSADTDIAIVSNTGQVIGVGAGTTTFTFTDTYSGCTSTTGNLRVSPEMSLEIDYLGGVCVTTGSRLAVDITGGTAPYTYSWSGPNSLTSTTDTLEVTDSGNYYVTVTDDFGCEAEISGYVYQEYDPYIFTLNNEVCEGEVVNLSVNSSSAESYLWSTNAGNATTSAVTVTPSTPSSQYFVTITNDLGCEAVATINITVFPKTPVSVTGSNIICAEETTTLSPTSGGTWQSSNPSIATVAPNGVVTAVSEGDVTFIFNDDTNNCDSDPTATVTIQEKPEAIFLGPISICEGESTSLAPLTGGIWTSTNEGIATITNAGVVTTVSHGAVSFVFENSTTGCISDPSELLTIYEVYDTDITGDDDLCVGENTFLSPTSGGVWSSSDPQVATVTDLGVVSAVGAGNAYFTFVSNFSCTSNNTAPITVSENVPITISGDFIICEEETTTLTASISGGIWQSSNNTIATVSAGGVVTGIAEGSASITYIHHPDDCAIDETVDVTILDKPDIFISGATDICVGETTTLISSQTDGQWVSNDPSVALINSDGIVVGVSGGSTNFYYQGSNNCNSEVSGTLTVNPELNVNITFNGSVCLRDDTQLTANVSGGTPDFDYLWSGPGGFTSNLSTIDILLSGNYTVVITDDAGCTVESSAYVYETYEPYIFTLNTTVCDGDEVTLSVNDAPDSDFIWSASAGGSTSQSITVTPSVPSTTYTVTITNDQGCSSVASAQIDVNSNPIISLIGDDTICENETTSFTTSTNGVWTSTDFGVISIDEFGVATGENDGIANIIFQDTLTGCFSDPSEDITVTPNSPISVTGNDNMCMGSDEIFTASIPGGQWSSSNTSVAVVDPNSGLVTPVSQGVVTITYIVNGILCYDPGFLNVTVNNLSSVSLNGPSTICEGYETYLIPSAGGSWASSDNSVATVDNFGVVSGISGGTVTFTFTSDAGCSTVLGQNVTVVSEPVVSINGDSELCIGETTNLLPSSGGLWISSNDQVASVNSQGEVTANKAGIAHFTYVEYANGCTSSTPLEITVNPTPIINGLNQNEICEGELTFITPSTGGTWESSDTDIATISNSGVITAVSSGSVSFTYVENATGCISNQSETLIVNGRPQITINGPTQLCVGETSNVLPTSGGSWSSSNIIVASITTNGEITALSAGDVQFTFTSSSTGCNSLLSELFTISDPSSATITSPSNICMGETTIFNGSHSGSWSSDNPSIGSIDNGGVFTAVAPGVVNITLNTYAACIDNPTVAITVDALPILSIEGPSSICDGETSQLSPQTGGVWSSANESVATVNNAGVVTSTGPGETTFTFVSNITGCTSTTASFNVYSKPEIMIAGDDEICIGGVTSMSPSTGGTWQSTDETIATISISGLVTGVSAGTVSFIFTESGTGCVSDVSDPITILPRPNASVTGDNTLCIGEQSTLAPTMNGSWVSSDEDIATVTDVGIVTATGQGIVKFTFISNEGCASNETSPIIVFGAPTVLIDGDDEICIGSTVQMIPNSGGTWVSTDESIATITDAGLVTGVAEGTVRFIFTDGNTNCSSEPSDPLIVNPLPDTNINGADDICIGGITNMVPSTGGTWESSDPSIATIDNTGKVTGIASGTVHFIFTHLGTGCMSLPSDDVVVNSTLIPVYTGPTTICIGDTTYITPNAGGTWESTDESIATITDDGMIIAIGQGVSRFRFTENMTGCISDFSGSLTVNGTPPVSINGSADICITGGTQLIPSSGGTWESSAPTVASVDNSGKVTGITEGTAYFTFTDNITGCSSDGLLSVNVLNDAQVTITGEQDICVGYSTSLSPSSGGTWTSSNPDIATIANNGIVTARAPGKVTFQFFDLASGCASTSESGVITIVDCKAQDFNASISNLEVFGDLSTNDDMPLGSTYLNVVEKIESPIASIYSLDIETDGTYTFTANKEGNYTFKVPVCGPGQTTGCPTTLLSISVNDNIYSEPNASANIDFNTSYRDPDLSLPGDIVITKVLENDECVYTAGCSLDNSSVSILNGPSNGAAIVTGSGSISYTSSAGFIGYDTLEYQVCTNAPIECNSSFVVYTVNDTSAINTTVAADDFSYSMKGISVNRNVIANDSDPEGDNLSINPQGSLLSPIITSSGSYFIESNGYFQFTPNDDFVGYTEIEYTLCDDNASQVCKNATIHILVFDDIQIRIKMYIEGSLIKNGDELSSQGHPLMRDNLRNSPFTGENYIPLTDPYTNPINAFSDITNMYEKTAPHLYNENQSITDSLAVFGVTGENAIVDWVYIELRSKNDMSVPIASRSGLLQRDGDVVDLDGVSPLRFQGVNVDSFYVVAKHRSHLGVMSMKVHFSELVDFTDVDFPVFNFGATKHTQFDYTGLSTKNTVKSGYRACWAGDLDSNGRVKFTSPSDDQNIVFKDVLFTSPEFLINYNGTIGYYLGDYDMNSKVKYTNPNDDKNYIFGQLILYPLNSLYISNFNFLIEQVAEK